MGTTTFSGPVYAGTIKDPIPLSNLGTVVLEQDVLVAFNGTLVQTASFNIPAYAQILNITVDPLTAYNSATSATLAVGTSSGDTSYASGVDVKGSTTRVIPTFTTTQLTNMQSVGTNTTVVATVTSVGQPTAGNALVAVFYAQNVNSVSNS